METIAMPAQNIASRATAATPAVPLNGYYPKLLQGDSGSVWLVTGPKTGTIVHLSARPQKGKHKVGYSSAKLVEGKMKEFKGSVTITV